MKIEDMFDLMICALLSVLGGLGRILSAKSKKPVKISELTRNAVVSLSIGVGIFFFVYALVPEAKDNAYLVFAAGWAAGFVGPWVVNKAIDKYLEDKGIKKEEK